MPLDLRNSLSTIANCNHLACGCEIPSDDPNNDHINGHSEPPRFQLDVYPSTVKNCNNDNATATDTELQRLVGNYQQQYGGTSNSHQTAKTTIKTAKTTVKTVESQGRKSRAHGTDAKSSNRAKANRGHKTIVTDAKTTTTNGKMPIRAYKNK
jgi:hypothetical protein